MSSKSMCQNMSNLLEYAFGEGLALEILSAPFNKSVASYVSILMSALLTVFQERCN